MRKYRMHAAALILRSLQKESHDSQIKLAMSDRPTPRLTNPMRFQ